MKESTPKDSLKKRYAFKLLTNLLGLPIGIVSQSIIPRGLGPAAYGNFSFLTDSFSQIINFFDSGTSLGFYVKLSQRQKEKELLRFYWNFMLLIAFLLVLLVGSALVLNLESVVWPGQQIKFVWLAVIFALLGWFSEISLKVVDAHGLTKKGELARLLQRILGFCLLLLMFYFQRLGLAEFFIYNYATAFLLIALWWRILKKSGIDLFPALLLPFDVFSRYAREFYHYSAPLFAYTAIGLITGLADRWLLQKFSGSTEQGFYGLSYQIGAVCFLFTSAMTPLFTREFSIAHQEKNMDNMRHYFKRFIPMLYSMAAFLSIFIMVTADKVAVIMGGVRFEDSWGAIAIMALYPIHQTYGQLSGSVFYATGRTKLYRNIGGTFMVLSIPFTFVILAPPALHGLNLGSYGLAIKMVLFQLVAVNFLLWFNCKFLGLPFLKFLFHQVYVLMVFGLSALGSVYVVDLFIDTPFTSFVVAGCIYVIIVALIAVSIPSVFSLTRKELLTVVSDILNKIK